MRRLFTISLMVFTFVVGNAFPTFMQTACNTLPARLITGETGRVAFTDGAALNMRTSADRTSDVVGLLPEGMVFDVLEGPVCADDINWWRIQSGDVSGWVAEAAGGVYLIEPYTGAAPATPSQPALLSQGRPFSVWDWAAFVGEDYRGETPDPMAINLPAAYAGDLPALPVNLSGVLFVEDAGLNENQRALLIQNGFVVVPAGLPQFSDAYAEFTEEWPTVPNDFDYAAEPSANTSLGHPMFVTTDSMLHALHYIFDNLLTDLERSGLIRRVQNVTRLSLAAAVDQYNQAGGTLLETPARNAALYLLVAARLLSPEAAPPDGLDAALVSEAETLAAAALAGEGQLPVSFLPGYMEDFSQYRPRGHYAGDESLERYFRGMMWLSRMTFCANDDAETLTALMLLRALRSQTDAQSDWQDVHDTLTFLIGPVDDLGPMEYAPLADEIFGADWALDRLADPASLAAFRARLDALPGPRINGLVLPDATETGEVTDLTRGFRLMGQRFTFDGYVLQQLMIPYVGTQSNPRVLPLALDVPAAMGSDMALAIMQQAGGTNFENYDTQMAMLRGQIDTLTRDNWLENTYSGWLWTLEPLWVRESAPYPPLMQTDAWRTKDLQSGLASWTELKHDTVLYVKQPTGFGGGGPPLASYGYVEPNPLVFARISVVAALTLQGLTERGIVNFDTYEPSPEVIAAAWELRELAFNAARFAEIARKELAGEPLTDGEYGDIQTYGTYLDILLRTLYQGEGEPDPVALVTDVASNPSVQAALQEGVGGVDYIYVVISAPGDRLQVARGGVFSYYEFVNDINQRMTDDEWRSLVGAGQLPPRPAWVSTFLGE